MTAPGEENGAGSSDEDPGLGAPMIELREVSVVVGDRFVGRVRGRIERRMLAADILELLWMAPLTMLLEFLRWPFEGFSRDGQ